MTQKTIKFFSFSGLLCAALIWGFAFVVVKDSLETIPVFYMMAFRFTIATLGLILIFLPRLKNINKSTLLQGSILGIFLFLAYGFQTVGCKFTTPGKNAFLTTIYVILIPFLAWFIEKQKPRAKTLIAAVFAITGIGLLSLTGNLSINNNEELKGDTLTLICGFLFAIHVIYIDKFTKRSDPVLLTIIQIAVTAILSWITAPIIDGKFDYKLLLSVNGASGILYLGLLSTMLAFLLQNVCQKYTPPALASILISFESVFGILFSVIFGYEAITLKTIFGCLLIFIAVLISQDVFSRKKTKKTA